MRLAAMSAVTLFALAGCRPDDQRTETADPTGARAELSVEALAQLDSANAAYRTTAYETALRHYLRVTELEPEAATGWFGVYMAHHALGNLEAAEDALARSRDLAPGASLIRPDADTLDGGGR